MGVVVDLQVIGILLFIWFVYWLFTSKTKVQDIEKVSGFLDRVGNKIDEFNSEFDRKKEEKAKRKLETDYQDLKQSLSIENLNRKVKRLSELTLEDYLSDKPEYHKIAVKDIQQERAVITELKRKAKIKKEYFDLKTKFENIKRTRQESLAPLSIESFFGYNPEYLELALKDYPSVVQEVTQPVEVELDELPAELVEFIYVRYYLTGDTSLPKLKCIYDSWEKTPYTETELNEEIWGKVIEQMSFDATKRKKIDGLYHFTHKENLPSILSNGLLTKKTLEEQKISYKHNDENRWDMMEGSISLSISRPHHKMFMKYAKPTGVNNWVILKISPLLLSGAEQNSCELIKKYDYLDKAIFNKYNAASFAMKKLSIEQRKSHKAFLDMFESNIGKTLETFTFDNQAEILYLGNIPKEFIEEIQVVEENDELAWVRDFGFKLNVNTTVLEKR